MWLLGGITKERFLCDARHYRAGEPVHQNYVVREGHEIFNIERGRLQGSNAWVSSFDTI
jgi:hypothetical protein